jgi:hypothetical protein
MSTIAAVLGLASAAGINAYATLLALGLCVRFELVSLDSSVARFFAEPWVLVVVGILYLLEFVADKIPAVDHVWDMIHTFIRPVAGAATAIAVVSGSKEGWVVLAALVGGATSLVFHTAKSTGRVVVNTSSAGSLGWLASLVEDLVAITTSVLALLAPALALLAIATIALYWAAMWRKTRKKRGAEAL